MYGAALLGFPVLGEGALEGDAYVLFGRSTSDDFALHAVGTKPVRNRVTTGAHVAFRAPDASGLERWHAAAIRGGGTDNGAPGVRPEYSGRYYAAFGLDLTASTRKRFSTSVLRSSSRGPAPLLLASISSSVRRRSCSSSIPAVSTAWAVAPASAGHQKLGLPAGPLYLRAVVAGGALDVTLLVTPAPYEPASGWGGRRMNQFGTPRTGSSPITSKPKRS
jgi:hypothetical protein